MRRSEGVSSGRSRPERCSHRTPACSRLPPASAALRLPAAAEAQRSAYTVSMKVRRREKMYVQSLFVYPIKSGAGIEVEALRLLPHGPQYDRIFVVVDEAGQPLTQIGHPQLCLISTAITAEAFILPIPTVGEFSLPLERHEGSVRDVMVSGGTCQGLDEGDAIAEACSVFLAQPCRLVRYTPQYPHLHYSNYLQARVSISFAYACPVHII